MNKISKTISSLMLFPIIIGVCSLFLLFSINDAGKGEILKVMEEKGNASIVGLTDSIFTQKGKDEEPAGYLLYNDLQIIKNSCSAIKGISLIVPQHLQKVKIGNREYPPEDASHIVVPCILGINPEFNEVMNVRIKEGRFINKTDMIYKRRVCVLGNRIYERLGKGIVVGKVLEVKEPYAKFTIVGVLQKKMPLFTSLPEEMAQDSISVSADKVLSTEFSLETEVKTLALETNNGIYCPLTAWQGMMKGINSSSIYGIILDNSKTSKPLSGEIYPNTFINIKINIPKEGELINDEENLKIYKNLPCSYRIPKYTKLVVDKMRQVLRKRYGDDKLFDFFYRGNLTDEINTQIEDSNKLLIITGIITLFLSGVILSSTMLLSVHKRVQEIGIRRAFGARKRDIFFQFLGEGMIIYTMGITIGLVVGMVLSYLVIVKMLSWEYSIFWYTLVLSSIVPFLVGIISSLYPAMKAANIPPAIAVKHE